MVRSAQPLVAIFVVFVAAVLVSMAGGCGSKNNGSPGDDGFGDDGPQTFGGDSGGSGGSSSGGVWSSSGGGGPLFDPGDAGGGHSRAVGSGQPARAGLGLPLAA